VPRDRRLLRERLSKAVDQKILSQLEFDAWDTARLKHNKLTKLSAADTRVRLRDEELALLQQLLTKLDSPAPAVQAARGARIEESVEHISEQLERLEEMVTVVHGVMSREPLSKDAPVTGDDEEILKEAADLRIGLRARQERLNVLRPIAKGIEQRKKGDKAHKKDTTLKTLKVIHADTTLPIGVTPEMTIAMLKVVCLEKFAYDAGHDCSIRLGRTTLLDEKLLSELGLQDKATLCLVVVPLLESITIKSRLFANLVLKVTGSLTIRDVKGLIVRDAAPKKAFSGAEELQLAKGKTVFEDGRTLTDYNFQNEATLTCSKTVKPKAANGAALDSDVD
jgi:hypothetical protein